MSLLRRLRWLYKKLRLRRLQYALPFVVLAGYTILGAYIFRHFELEPDEQRRRKYRADTEYAFNQVLNRMMEIRCEDKLFTEDQQLQARHTKDALFWLIDYLNLTQVLEERSESSPWTWPGAMFYAGQLYTTIGYGLPVAQTAEGRLASILYIMIGIPIFLLILAQVGKLLSRACRKIYKRLRTAKSKLPEDMTRKMSEPVKAIYNLTPSLLSNGGTPKESVVELEKSSPSDASEAATATADETESKRNLLPTKTHIVHSSGPINPTEELHPDHDELNKQLYNNKQQHVKAEKKDSSGSFPIPLALALLMMWIAFSAAMFCLWETDWGYLMSVYFFFVSISTVGLGDIVPTKPDMMFINFMLILIGLALLSMCINLIQEALERLIERLIEEYIDEIEKIAAVVTHNEEFAEEAATPFEIGMTAEMLTVPLASIAHNNQKPGTWRAMKDWLAERIASNVLISRLDPSHSSNEFLSDSSESENESDEERAAEHPLPRLEDGTLARRAQISVVSGGGSVGGVDAGVIVELPTIEVHEGTPLSSRTSERFKDGISFSSERRRSRRRKHPMTPAAGALSTFSKSTMRAIQAIETAKMRTYQNDDFKSRLFAKFVTNERLARLVDDHIVGAVAAHDHAHPPAAKMVSEGSQTTPPPPLLTGRADDRLRSVQVARHFTLESMDSTSSDAANYNAGDWASNSAFDADSLYSAGYYDMSFGGYSTESMQRLLNEPNTPETADMSPARRRPSRQSRYLFCSSGTRLNAFNSSASIDIGMTISASSVLPYRIRRLSPTGIGTASMPGSPPTSQARRTMADLPCGILKTSPNVAPMPKISLIDCNAPASSSGINIADMMAGSRRFPSADSRDAAASRSSPTPTTSPTVGQRRRRSPRHHSGEHTAQEGLPPISPPPLLGCIPLHHRLLAAKRRFSDNDCQAPRATIAELHGSLAGSRRGTPRRNLFDYDFSQTQPDFAAASEVMRLRPRVDSGGTAPLSSASSEVVSVLESEDWLAVRQAVEKLVDRVSR